MNDLTAWLIALAFYAPIHFLGPVLVALLTGPETPERRRALLNGIFIDCGVSMLIAFALAIPLFEHRPGYAAAVLLAAMTAPYFHLWIRVRRTRSRG